MIKALKKELVLLVFLSSIMSIASDLHPISLPVTGMVADDLWVNEIGSPTTSIFINDNLEVDNNGEETAILNDFIHSVANGQSDEIRGIIMEDSIALNVIPQPAGQPAFVSSVVNVITEFSIPRKFGVIGFLAHNYLAGRFFYDIKFDDIVKIVYGDGEILKYKVIDIQKYQALQPNSPHSEFLDLNTLQKLSATQLFQKVYTGDHHITLQTCIQEGTLDTWGRLFIIAEPVA